MIEHSPSVYPVAGGFHAAESTRSGRRVAFGRTPRDAEAALAALRDLDVRLRERVNRGDHLKTREERRP